MLNPCYLTAILGAIAHTVLYQKVYHLNSCYQCKTDSRKEQKRSMSTMITHKGTITA